MVKGLDDNFFKVPNDIGLILKTPYEYVALSYLLRCADDNNQCFPSYNKLSQGLMTRRHCMDVCEDLKNRGYIKIRKREFKSNIFTINIEKVVNDIHQCKVDTSDIQSPSKPKSKYTENQKDIMAEKQATKHVDVAHKAELKNGYDVFDENGKIVNNVVTNKKITRGE